ncbi:hypothetical protein L596_003316 [Steinernema carpocapsae]|uniref:Cilia- and flagella-associated protein 57 n=1 Tax=Steinernema carpocapsae TaxID=34508 RepID=A0A4V6I7Y7_STECR|nr:hypothetical protein L596_003316 [Steinernema carpocapsae]
MSATSVPSSEISMSEYELISGYNHVLLRKSDQICFSRGNRLIVIDLDVNESLTKMCSVEMKADITSMTFSSDFQYLALSLTDKAEENFSVVVLNALKDFKEAALYSSEVAGEILRIDDSNENVVVFAPGQSRESATIVCFALLSGHRIASVELDNHEKSDVWEITLCPTDEQIMCVLSSSSAYLLRKNGSVIQTFSSISLFGVTCHIWSSDVTIAFGTDKGSILFYRETLALETVDLGTILKSYLNDSKVSVTALYATTAFFVAFVASRIMLMFPISNAQIQWNKARVVLHTEIQFLGVTHENGFDLLTAKHNDSVVFATYEILSGTILSVDSKGFVLVQSLNTGRMLSWRKMKNLVGIDFLCGGYYLLIATKNSLKCFVIEYKSIVKRNVVCKTKIEKMSLSWSRKRCAVVSQSGFTFIDIANNYFPVAIVQFDFLSAIELLEWNSTNDRIAVLTQKQTLFVFEYPTGDLCWSRELKLHCIVSMSFRKDTVFALTQKFVIFQITESCETLLVISCDRVTYNATSTVLCSTSKSHIVGVSDGSLMEVFSDGNTRVLEKASYVTCLTLHYDERTQVLYVGYEDGSIARFSFEGTDIPAIGIASDCVLCPLAVLDNNRRLINLLDVERNNLRIQTSNLLEKYRQKTEKEMMAANAELQAVIQGLEKQLDELSEKNRIDVEESHVAVRALKKNHEDNMNLLKNQHKTVLSQQIRLHIEQQKKANNEIKQLQEEYKQIRFENKHEIEILKVKLAADIEKSKEKVRKAKKEKRLVESEVKEIKEKSEAIERLLRNRLQAEEEKLKRLNVGFRDERIQLKANVLIAQDAVSEFRKNEEEARSVLDGLSKEIGRYRVMVEDKERQINQYLDELKTRNADQAILQKNILLVQKKNAQLEQQIKDETKKESCNSKTQHLNSVLEARCGEASSKVRN